MSSRKSSILILRLQPEVKDALRYAAELDHRSVSNLVELLIRNHCQSMRITIPEQQSLFVQEKEVKYRIPKRKKSRQNKS